MSEPHVCQVANRTTDPRGEYVEVANGGSYAVALTGLELTDYTGTQQRPHIYRFPTTTTGEPLTLQPSQSAFIFTGQGRNRVSDSGDFLLFWGLSTRVWNDSGDVAYVRDAHGRIVDSRTVGHPKRHPYGH